VTWSERRAERHRIREIDERISGKLLRAGDRNSPADASGLERILEATVKQRFFQHLITLQADTRCAVDLLRYFYRHPSVYVTTDQLASSVGYGRDNIEAAIGTLTQGGLIVQRGHRRLTAALYHLVAEKWVSELAHAASTARGRRHLRLVLRSHELCRRAAVANARANARLDRSGRLLTMIRLIPRAGS
jgi:hypothetical protein